MPDLARRRIAIIDGFPSHELARQLPESVTFHIAGMDLYARRSLIYFLQLSRRQVLPGTQEVA